MQDWKEDAEKGWKALSWEGEAQWFATKEERVTQRWYGTRDGKPYGEDRAETRKRVMGGRFYNLDNLLGAIRNAEALGWNLYLGLNPSRRTGKAKASREDITHWRYVLVDLDGGVAPPQPGSSREPGDQPSALCLWGHRIFTGRGYHYWIPLPPPIWECRGKSTDDYKRDAERTMQGFLKALAETSEQWAPGWTVDTHCSDLPRVVRCPGSVNQSSGKRAVFERAYGGCPFDMKELLKYADRVPELPPPVFGGCETANLLEALPHLNVRARTFILDGTTSPGRHNACFATCKNLQELGISAGTARTWLLIGAQKCWVNDLEQGGWRAKPLDYIAVDNIVKQVYKK